MILKQGHTYLPMPHDGKLIAYIYRGGRCYYKDSPYSLAATQALRAAFPQYWTAIRDYGYAHPQLVPFINEDPMLIVSLVEVGKTRWLVGDGKAWIDTGVLGNSSLNISAEMNVLFNTANAVAIGARNGNNGRFGLVFIYGSSWYLGVGSTDGSIKSITLNQEYHYKGEIGTSGYMFYENGVQIAKGTTTCDTNLTMYLFAYNYNGGTQYPMIGKMDGCLIKSNDQPVRHFIPMQRTDGTCGMLDIVSLTFHPNANTEGSFTIQVTDKE